MPCVGATDRLRPAQPGQRFKGSREKYEATIPVGFDLLSAILALARLSCSGWGWR